MSDALTLTIGSTTTHLIPPKSPTVRLELMRVVPSEDQSLPVRTAAAAIGLCWPAGPTRPAAKYAGDVATYGLAVADDLFERGLTITELNRAGWACLNAVASAGLPTIGDAKEAARPFDAKPPEESPPA